LIGFLLLHFISKRHQKYAGQVFYWYLVWYGFERMIVEGLRTDSLYMPFSVFGYDIRVSQVLSALLLIFGIVMIIVNRKKEDKFYGNYRRKKGVS
jgi:phosphatidylglycerol:prolipoprotein diacylglycerol transferase